MSWAGIALALRSPGEDALNSRLPTYLHPLAGRILAWHVLRALASREPPPDRLILAAATPLDPGTLAGLPAEVVTVEPGGNWWRAVEPLLGAGIERVLLVDAAAPALDSALDPLFGSDGDRVLRGDGGVPVAAALEPLSLRHRASGGAPLAAVADGFPALEADPDEAFVVRDRRGLARAAVRVRDRLVCGILEGGATVLLPETVLVDVDVTVGPDTVIYPGVVLEGTTTIGAESVIGPGCRIVDSRIGSGVELKGWNYIVGAHIRNRAVLEPYVRRGFD